jgi:hypothetical protein
MARMFNRHGGWWPLWMTLTVMWTIVAITYGWMNLPRAQQMPHDPQFLSKLSNEASSILFGRDAGAEPARGALVWSENPRMVRMSNGTRLTFPATATGERVAFVRGEYRQLLDTEADEQRGPYLLKMLAIWLAPLLVAGLVAGLLRRGYKPPLSRVIPGRDLPSSMKSAVASAFALSGKGNRTDGGIMASSLPFSTRVVSPPSFMRMTN